MQKSNWYIYKWFFKVIKIIIINIIKHYKDRRQINQKPCACVYEGSRCTYSSNYYACECILSSCSTSLFYKYFLLDLIPLKLYGKKKDESANICDKNPCNVNTTCYSIDYNKYTCFYPTTVSTVSGKWIF